MSAAAAARSSDARPSSHAIRFRPLDLFAAAARSGHLRSVNLSLWTLDPAGRRPAEKYVDDVRSDQRSAAQYRTNRRRVFDVVLVRFALERVLYRLSISAHRDRIQAARLAEQHLVPDAQVELDRLESLWRTGDAIGPRRDIRRYNRRYNRRRRPLAAKVVDRLNRNDDYPLV
jgi:hypothetical protein